MLANVKGIFSEAQIGSIAYQLLSQLRYLHKRGIECKFLTPQNITVLTGFENYEDIKVRITDLAIMQILDVAIGDGKVYDKVPGLDSIFLAPELTKKTKIP